MHSTTDRNEIQETFLKRAAEERVPVTMFLMNGFQMRGVITGHDAHVVVLDSDGRQQVIYKHAISTIAPVRPVELGDSSAETAGPKDETVNPSAETVG